MATNSETGGLTRRSTGVFASRASVGAVPFLVCASSSGAHRFFQLSSWFGVGTVFKLRLICFPHQHLRANVMCSLPPL